jgi:uncharacterized membrane protein YcgQ (UPF0703/DUF1980 family)
MNEDNFVPVFIFTGFLESGKTTFINNEWLKESIFHDGSKTVLIQCEEGVETFNEWELNKSNISLIKLDDPSQYTQQLLADINEKYHPDNVIIEKCTSQTVEEMFSFDYPEDWGISDIITLLDASTFDMYSRNMGKLMLQQYQYASIVVFNRCDENTSKQKFRANIKASNPQASVYFQDLEGNIEQFEGELPFDYNQDTIVLEDIDYGLFYIDLMDNPERYENKTITFKGQCVQPKGFPKTAIASGRKAMTCCADDVQFLRLLCLCDNIKMPKFKDWDWLTVTGVMNLHSLPESPDQPMPVLTLTDLQKSEPAQTEMVYFS